MANEAPGARKPADSVVETTTIVMPGDANVFGNLFGGALMALIDKAAAIAAYRHARRNVVTASIDRVDFLRPIRTGDIVSVRARLQYTGRTSMEIGVEVTAEDRIHDDRASACRALLTFVAIDDLGRPVAVPPLAPETDEERALFDAGRERAEARRRERGASG